LYINGILYDTPLHQSPDALCQPTNRVKGMKEIQSSDAISKNYQLASSFLHPSSDFCGKVHRSLNGWTLSNILCGKINNVICYFGKCQSIIKQKLLFAYCCSLHGCVLWDLNNRCVCVKWHKGLCRVWNLPSDTHSVLLPVLSNTLLVID